MQGVMSRKRSDKGNQVVLPLRVTATNFIRHVNVAKQSVQLSVKLDVPIDLVRDVMLNDQVDLVISEILPVENL